MRLEYLDTQSYQVLELYKFLALISNLSGFSSMAVLIQPGVITCIWH